MCSIVYCGIGVLVCLLMFSLTASMYFCVACSILDAVYLLL